MNPIKSNASKKTPQIIDFFFKSEITKLYETNEANQDGFVSENFSQIGQEMTSGYFLLLYLFSFFKGHRED